MGGWFSMRSSSEVRYAGEGCLRVGARVVANCGRREMWRERGEIGRVRRRSSKRDEETPSHELNNGSLADGPD